MKKTYFYLCIPLLFLSYLCVGCKHTNVYIEGIEQCTNEPSYRVPIKFCITNNVIVSDYCVKNYPHLFTNDSEAAIPMTIEAPWGRKDAVAANENIGFTFALSFCSFGIIPAILTRDGMCKFGIKLPSTEVSKDFPFEIVSVANVGIVGYLLPTCLLQPKWDAVLSGWGRPRHVYVNFNEKYLGPYCRVFVHLLSSVPAKKIERLYYSQMVPPVKLLK